MAAAITPLNIHVGRGDVWIGVDVPVEGETVPLNGLGEPATGRNIGATIEGSNWIYRPGPLDIRIQQSTVIAGFVVTEEEMRLEFGVGEMTYQNYKDMFATPRDQGSFISIGGLVVPLIQSCLIVAPRRGGGFIEAMIYAAAFLEDRSIAFARESLTSAKVVARGQGVFTRTYGDQLGFFAPAVFATL